MHLKRSDFSVVEQTKIEMAEGGDMVESHMRGRIVSSSSVDNDIPEQPELRRSLSMKNLWTLKKKMPRPLLEQELVECRIQLSELQFLLYEKEKQIWNITRNKGTIQRLPEAEEMVQKLINENKRLHDELARVNNSKTELIKRIEAFVKENPFSVHISGASNVQVGENNTLIEKDGDVDQMVNIVEEMFGKLTLERKDTEIKLRDAMMMKKECEESVAEILKSLKKNLDENTSKKIERDIEMLEVLTSDRTDKHVITEGVNKLRRHLEQHTLTDTLPLATETAIKRLVNKCESLKCDSEQFAALLDVDMTAVFSDTGDHFTLLDRKTCENILVHWIKKSSANDAGLFLSSIDNFERRVYDGMLKEFQGGTVNTQHNKETQMPSLPQVEGFTGPSDMLIKDNRGQNLQGFPDEWSILMHQVNMEKIIFKISEHVEEIHERVVQSASGEYLESTV